MRTNIPYSQTIRNQSISDYCSGMSYRDVGLKYGIDHKTIMRWLKVSNITGRTKEEAYQLESMKFKGVHRSPSTEFKKNDLRHEIKNQCIDCGCYINIKGIRCRSCAMKNLFKEKSHHPRFGKEGLSGAKSPCYGLEKSDETKQKISKKLKGKFCGDKHWNWKNGITPIHSIIRNCYKNNEWRKSVFQRDSYRCQNCGQIGSNLEAHHIKPFSMILREFLSENGVSNKTNQQSLLTLALDYHDFWDENNGTTLCAECHNKTKSNATWGYEVL